MDAVINPTSKKGKYILTGLFVLVLAIILFILYKMFIQFKDSEVRRYIDLEASKYSDKAGATKILSEGAKHILSSYHLTKQVLGNAKAAGTPNEQELVHAALMQSKAYGYLG